jgi:hypothetical protein
MAKRKKVVPIPQDKWCSCKEWPENQWQLSNHAMMNFCIFCGKKLTKERVI